MKNNNINFFRDEVFSFQNYNIIYYFSLNKYINYIKIFYLYIDK